MLNAANDTLNDHVFQKIYEIASLIGIDIDIEEKPLSKISESEQNQKDEEPIDCFSLQDTFDCCRKLLNENINKELYIQQQQNRNLEKDILFHQEILCDLSELMNYAIDKGLASTNENVFHQIQKQTQLKIEMYKIQEKKEKMNAKKAVYLDEIINAKKLKINSKPSELQAAKIIKEHTSLHLSQSIEYNNLKYREIKKNVHSIRNKLQMAKKITKDKESISLAINEMKDKYRGTSKKLLILTQIRLDSKELETDLKKTNLELKKANSQICHLKNELNLLNRELQYETNHEEISESNVKGNDSKYYEEIVKMTVEEHNHPAKLCSIYGIVDNLKNDVNEDHEKLIKENNNIKKEIRYLKGRINIIELNRMNYLQFKPEKSECKEILKLENEQLLWKIKQTKRRISDKKSQILLLNKKLQNSLFPSFTPPEIKEWASPALLADYVNELTKELGTWKDIKPNSYFSSILCHWKGCIDHYISMYSDIT